MRLFRLNDFTAAEIGIMLYSSVVGTLDLYKLLGAVDTNFNWILSYAAKGRDIVSGLADLLKAESVALQDIQN